MVLGADFLYAKRGKSVRLFVRPSVRPSVCLSVRPSVRPSGPRSVCPSVHHLSEINARYLFRITHLIAA